MNRIKEVFVPQTPQEAHDQNLKPIVEQIVRPTIEAGGTMIDILILLESVTMGVIGVVAKPGGEEIILDELAENVKRRFAEVRLRRLRTAKPKGSKETKP